MYTCEFRSRGAMHMRCPDGIGRENLPAGGMEALTEGCSFQVDTISFVCNGIHLESRETNGTPFLIQDCRETHGREKGLLFVVIAFPCLGRDEIIVIQSV